MTTELDAIRARDAVSAWGPEDALPACLDRRTLLAEVDRLRAKVPFLMAEVDRLTADLALVKAVMEAQQRGHAECFDRERARIRAAVEGLPGVVLSVAGRPALPADGEWVVSRADVLRAIDGDEDGVYIGPIQHSNAQCWSKDDPTCHCWCAVCERHNR